ncbi:hypothetical protein MTKAM_12680 [Moorella thermoacetica]
MLISWLIAHQVTGLLCKVIQDNFSDSQVYTAANYDLRCNPKSKLVKFPSR